MSVLDPIPSGRWTANRKSEVCVAIARGHVAREAAMAAHDLSHEELESWLDRQTRAGVRGLKITKLQELRR